jgi:hypothetical protein
MERARIFLTGAGIAASEGFEMTTVRGVVDGIGALQVLR